MDAPTAPGHLSQLSRPCAAGTAAGGTRLPVTRIGTDDTTVRAAMHVNLSAYRRARLRRRVIAYMEMALIAAALVAADWIAWRT